MSVVRTCDNNFPQPEMHRREMWKALNKLDYTLKIKQQAPETNRVNTRADKNKRPCEIGTTCLTQNTCISDAVRLWNIAPKNVASCQTVYQAKKEIKAFVKLLPI